MRICEIKLSPRRQNRRNELSPAPELRKPVDCSPGGVDEVKSSEIQTCSLIDRSFNESGVEPRFAGEATGYCKRLSRKIKSSGDGTPSDEGKRVTADMTLEMKDTFAGDVTKLGRLYAMKGILACSKPVERIFAGCVSSVNNGPSSQLRRLIS